MDDNLTAKLAAAVAAFKAMTPEERAAMYAEQSRSYVRGEAGMGSDADEAEYARAHRAGDADAIAECKRKSEERVAAANRYMTGHDA